MKDLAILVDNKNDSTEAQDLLFSMGYKWRGLGENSKSYFYPRMNKYFIFMNKNEMDLQMAGYFAGSSRSYAESRFKEITLPELRDLVVLNRNDAGDATHEDYLGLKHLLLMHTRHVWGGEKWLISTADFSKLKPIEKTEMKAKEYLNKETHAYVKTHDLVSKDSNWIEIPEWAVAYADHKNGHGFFYDSFCKIASFYNIAWSRHTLPEELPFIDDECYTNKSDGGFRLPKVEPCDMSKWIEIRGDSLNDQYAEIETVRQSAWQKQEGGSHYKNLKIQPMQYALENKLDYAQANVVKYVTRHKEKNGKEDLLKAIHNIELMIEFYYGDEK